MKEITETLPVQEYEIMKIKSAATIENLPDPIIEYIFSYLSPYKDLKQCMLVNKSWYRFVCDVVRKTQRDFLHAVCRMSVLWCRVEAEPGPTITKRYSHSACGCFNSMFVFGGCTTANTTFNDLWRLDLDDRTWVRPLATGTYPPPKACATLVNYGENLILFGGWTHTAPYPLHQVWRIFNQIHVYNTNTNRWNQITTSTICPPMAGHSATVHGDMMVVFGGVQKQVCDGPFVRYTSDIWTLDLRVYKWQKQVTNPETPPPRYGHSQIPIDKDYLLIVGGCGGPNMLYTDVWLLDMTSGPNGVWKWTRMDIREKENAAPQIAFHPACKVGTQVVVLSKSHRSRTSLTSLPHLLRAPSRTWVPPRLEDDDSAAARTAKRSSSVEAEPCVNGKRGTLKRPQERRPVSSSDDDELQQQPAGRLKGAAASIVNNFPLPQPEEPRHRKPSPHTSSGAGPSTSRSPPTGPPQGPGPGAPPPDSPRQANGPASHARRNRQRQLEGLDRMEQRLKDLRAGSASQPVAPRASRGVRRPLCMYVLDISCALEGHVTWRPVNPSPGPAPEEIILYSLVAGRGEVVMFGGIQKDLNSSQQRGECPPEVVSNSLHFMTAQRFVI